MFEADDFLMAGALLLGVAYVIVAVRGGPGGSDLRYRKGLRYFLIAVVTMIVVPEFFAVIFQKTGQLAFQILFGMTSWLVGVGFWLASLRALCLYLRGESGGIER